VPTTALLRCVIPPPISTPERPTLLELEAEQTACTLSTSEGHRAAATLYLAKTTQGELVGSNKLEPTDSRVGWAWDAKVKTPYPAMLRDRDGQVELVIPFDGSDQTLDRRYTGSLVRWGDDPEMNRYDYELPSQYWFADAKSFVSLNGIRSHTLEPIAGGPSIFKQCRLGIDYAVFGGQPGVDYSAVNGLMTRGEGLGRWFGHRSVQDNLHDPHRSGDEFTLTVTSPRTQRIDAGLNLSIVAGADWRLPGEAGVKGQ